MPLIDFTTSFRGGPTFFTGTGTTALVPDVFPVAINGRPYMIDSRSGRFTRQFDQRVRDSQDNSTAPGESAISPQGLWRRGQNSWHFGAGQKYADDAEAKDYRFFKSKGINPWTKGQLTLLNSTLLSLGTSSTNLHMCTVRSSGGTEYLYVADGNTLKYTTDPFSTSATWTSVTTGAPAGVAITGLETNGVNVFIAYTSNDIYSTTPGGASVSAFYPTTGTTGQTYTSLGYAKGWGFASVDNKMYVIGVGSGGHNVHYTSPDTTLRWAGFAAGQNAVYAAAYSGTHSIIYKLTLKADASGFDQPIAALELPVGEIVSGIFGYLGGIFIGTNKGVRYCTADSQNNLVAGAIIPTGGSVYDFTSEDKYVWFTWTNYDGTSSGLGRLDLSNFIAPNTPAFATDLMYSNTNAVKHVATIANKRVFSISGVGVIAEDSGNLVASGSIETGIYRWGIPDRKFAPRFDIRVQPLVGSVSASVSFDSGEYDSIGTHSDQNDTEHTFLAPEDKFIEASYKLALTRQTATTGPTLTRWMSRAYAAPSRSRLISVPVLIHSILNVHGKDYYMDVEAERDILDNLVSNPRIITYQEKGDTYSVIVEDVEWQALDATNLNWLWEGTATVIMRTVTE
jgi:hypothetical protein